MREIEGVRDRRRLRERERSVCVCEEEVGFCVYAAHILTVRSFHDAREER